MFLLLRLRLEIPCALMARPNFSCMGIRMPRGERPAAGVWVGERNAEFCMLVREVILAGDLNLTRHNSSES